MENFLGKRFVIIFLGLIFRKKIYGNCIMALKGKRLMAFSKHKNFINLKEDVYEVKEKLEEMDCEISCCCDDIDMRASISSSGSEGGKW